jgi:DNA polymerase-3 subunit alpha
MQVAREFAGYSLGEADLLRRAMRKKKEDIIRNQKEKFINQSIKRGHTIEKANEVYEVILKFASYGFNKSHSVAYSKISYDEAYLKAHYRPYFMKNMLNNSLGATENVREYINDLKKHKIEIIMPSINKSNLLFEINNNRVIYPFKGIKGIGQSAAQKINSERPFNDIFDFFKKCYSKEVNKKTIENLILSGCFDEFKYNRQTLMRNLDSLINYAETDYGIDLGIDLKPEIKIYEEFSNKDLLDFEYELFGFYLNDHPVKDFNSNTKINEFVNGRFVDTILLINRTNKIKTKKNDDMLFLTGSDETGDIELIMFPKVYEKIGDIKVGNIVRINGKVDYKESIQLIINDLKVLK